MALEHGGNIAAAAQRFNIPQEHWLDLSTGISPWSWSVPELPLSVWRNLPQMDGQLERTAAGFYRCGAQGIVAVPGSQYALQFAPGLLPPATVAMPLRGYAEHRRAWAAAGHRLVDYRDGESLLKLVQEAAVDHAVIINPNNPSCELLSRSWLEGLLQRLQDNGGWLVVDEAFGDASPEYSLAPLCPTPGLIVYRSLGKFFGLAGIRLGFMLAPDFLCEQLAARMPPWLLAHPARWIGARALADTGWHSEQRARLETAAARWQRTLQESVPHLAFAGTTLFVTGRGAPDYCRALYLALARRAVLARLFDASDGYGLLRFGLPHPDEWDRATQSIQESAEECACAMG